MRWWRDPIDPQVVARLEDVALRLEETTTDLREYIESRRLPTVERPRGSIEDGE